MDRKNTYKVLPAVFYFMIKDLLNKYLEKNGYDRLDLKAVIFDMDGVLYDSMPDHDRSWKETMDALGLKYEPNEFYMQEGRLGVDTIDTIIRRNYDRPSTKEEQETIYARKSALFKRYNNGKVIPGAKETLDYVKGEGLIPILVTGSGQPSLLDKISEPFPGIFKPETMVTAFNVEKGKPHPEPFLKGLKFGGNLKPNQAVVIENAPLGIEAATAANIFTIAINTGPLDNQLLMDEGAAMVFNSMDELRKELEKIIEYTRR